MRRLAAQRPVLLVNSIGMRMPTPGRSTQPLARIGRKLKSMAMLVRKPLKDTPQFAVMTPIVIPLYGSRLVRTMNAALVRVQVWVVMKWLKIEDPVFFVTIPTAWDVVSPMRRRAVIYNRSDKHSDFHEANSNVIGALETQLLANANLVLYTSHELMDSEKQVSGQKAQFLDHGVDFDHFSAMQTEPADFKKVPHPRAGFFGAIDDYTVDLGLIVSAARSFPDVQFVLIGASTCDMSEATQLSNVHWFGARPYEEIPAYGSYFDVALMPWLDNSWIRYSNPIKMKEYLALGLPVVSMDFPEVHRYSEHIAIAKTAEEFVIKIREVLTADTGNAEERRAAVRNDTWDARTKELADLVDGF